MDKEKKKKKIVWILLSCLSIIFVALTIAFLNEQAKQKENAERESIAESMSKAEEEAEVRYAIKKAEEEAAVARTREAVERLKAEAQAQQTTQTPVQTQTKNVARADEQPRPARNTQTQPTRQQTQTPVQTTQAPAPVETYNNGGPNIAGRQIETPQWVYEQLVSEGLGQKLPDDFYGPKPSKLMQFGNRLLEIKKQAGLR